MRPVAMYDVGLNNNQVGRHSEPDATSETTDNTILMVTNRTGNIVLYCDQEIPDNDAWDHSNWKCQRASQDYYKWQIEGEENNSRNESAVSETTNASNYYWKNSETPDDNEFNNNETVIEDSAIEDSVNQDVCKNEEKIFYEKPKLNFQTVTLLYDDVLPSTVKCMNYVNSIKDSESLEYLLESEDDTPEVNENQEKIETPEIVQKKLVKPEIIEDSSIPWENLDGSEFEGDVEIVELTKSVKDVIQFPEIEEIAENGKFTDETLIPEESTSPVIDHIDLIKEAKELPTEHKSNVDETKRLLKCPDNLKIIDSDSLNNFENDNYGEEQTTNYPKIEEIDLLSSIGRDIGVDLEKYVQSVPDVVAMETAKQGSRMMPNLIKEAKIRTDTNKLANHDMVDLSADTRKKEKMARNQARRRQNSHSTSGQVRRPEKRRTDHIVDNGPGGFDVYNIETAMPKIDLDVIESHLRAAREEERREKERSEENLVPALEGANDANYEYFEKEDLLARFDRLLEGEPTDSRQRRNDREEIRRRLAMGPDAEDLRAERGRKPSLQSRLQSGMNLQICFMNETPSDTESPNSENDGSPGPVSSYPKHQNGHQMASRPQVLSLPPLRVETGSLLANANAAPIDEADFFARQARLQTEARMALAQAKEMAHMQMEVERQRLKQSPITEMVRSSLEKVGVQLGEDRRRLSRVLLTELNVAQLQVVANDLHARIAMLNEALVEGLLRRDDLHMEQDSMLVDVEDLTRYLGAKQESMKKRSREIQHHRQQGKVEKFERKYGKLENQSAKLDNQPGKSDKMEKQHGKWEKQHGRLGKQFEKKENLENRSGKSAKPTGKLENSENQIEKVGACSKNNNETPKSLAREIMINCLMMRRSYDFSLGNFRKDRIE